MADLGPLYHWSPRARRGSIDRLGLVPGRRNVRGPSYHRLDGTGEEFRQPAVCFSLDPATAWAYSIATFGVPGVYDLWQVWLVDDDQVEVLPMWGARIIEVRVHNRVKKRRLVWVGERRVV